ncbi:putative bifunctional methylthioribulose-1-phosphate dehydratase/enolase-phosphatase E1 1 [Acorus calamus]|uniref:Bifunctional methylthioribulose-1-phosphate dehydratase/enolase-phosphatase E1 1 n=1 Tax=Acorus calamus TaxID=4465 RepID=A0AAV9FM24_ACOCL|nr:putative bifunctional methylthioribulose-1-phosphate dehydratase/enolase-phosphatase E1 1 [Acorus calamus]
MAAAAAVAAANLFPALASQAYLEGKSVKDTRSLVTDLCRQFYTLGWVSGTGGSITIKVHDDSVPRPNQLIVMSPSGTALHSLPYLPIMPLTLSPFESPSGVQKERMADEDLYVLSADGDVLCSPVKKPYPNKPPKCTDCAPLFMKAYGMRNAGAVIHSHGMESCLVTMIRPSEKEFRISHMEMIKGIQGHGYNDEFVVPIIENTPHERELTESLSEAIATYPKTTAVLVRNHGRMLSLLFDAAIKLYQLGLDWSTPSHGPIRDAKRCIVLDIEGTTTPISFVTEVLFPYARDNVKSHLTSTYETEETQDDIKLLCTQAKLHSRSMPPTNQLHKWGGSQVFSGFCMERESKVQDDLKQGVAGAVPIPPDDAGKEEVIASLVANVEAMIKADRKITSLKQLQGHIWRTGFEKKEIKGVVYDDVPGALEKWHDMGIKVYIYSSGSREAQRQIFGNTIYGDLRKYLCGFFDTTVGNKREARSYFEISESLGVDKPSQILFVTDVFQEAVAAKAAGLEVIISVRPGNGPLPENHGFRTVGSFSEI